MRTFAKTLCISALLMTGAAFAAVTATDPDVIARKDLMKTIGGAAKTLGGMASGEVAHDAAAAEAAKQAMIAAAAEIEAKFTNNAADPASEAKPEVWTNWNDFLAKGKALGDAAGALDVASAESIGAGMGAIGGTCKACHTDYRVQK
ncbi:COG3909 Cytochrome c556 [Paracoccaceae bacterium]|jgi:cytochrome c556